RILRRTPRDSRRGPGGKQNMGESVKPAAPGFLIVHGCDWLDHGVVRIIEGTAFLNGIPARPHRSPELLRRDEEAELAADSGSDHRRRGPARGAGSGGKPAASDAPDRR